MGRKKEEVTKSQGKSDERDRSRDKISIYLSNKTIQKESEIRLDMNREEI